MQVDLLYYLGKLLEFSDVLHVHMLGDTLKWFAGMIEHFLTYTHTNTHTAS